MIQLSRLALGFAEDWDYNSIIPANASAMVLETSDGVTVTFGKPTVTKITLKKNKAPNLPGMRLDHFADRREAGARLGRVARPGKDTRNQTLTA